MDSSMLPTVGMGSYLRYKADTNQCLSWLLNESLAIGYTIPSFDAATEIPAHQPGANSRAKRKQKNAKRDTEEEEPISQTKYIVKTRELIQQAELVSAQKTTVPSNVFRAWKRALAARKHAAARFASSDNSDAVSNSQHQHFNTLLEKVLNILRSSELPANPPTSGSSKGKAVEAPTSDDIPLLNRFEGLHVEDLEDGAEDYTTPPSCQSPSQPAYDFEYENTAEDSFKTEDEAFAVSCLFDDLQTLRAFIKETWESYKKDSLDAQTASFVTSAAIELAHRAEIDLMSRLYPTDFGLDVQLSHPRMLEILRSHQKQEEGPLTDLMVTPFDDLVYTRTSHCLSKFVESYIKQENLPFAVAISKPLLNYHNEHDLLELAAVKKSADDDKFLTQLLMDLALLLPYKKPPTDNDFVCDDEEIPKGWPEPVDMVCEDADAFTRGITEFIITSLKKKKGKGFVRNEPGVFLCFAAQTILDVRDIMGDQFKKTYGEWKDKLAKSDRSIRGDTPMTAYNIWFEGAPGRYLLARLGGSHHHPAELWKQQIQDRTTEADLQLLRSKIRPSWDEMHPTGKDEEIDQILERGTVEEYVKYRNETAILSSLDTSLVSSIPLAAGLRMLQLDLAVEEAGLHQGNIMNLSFFLAHLYNAARQLGLLETAWPDMEQFISINMSSIFYGRLPGTGDKQLGEFQNHLALKIGYLLSSVRARDREQSRIDNGKKARLRADVRQGPQIKHSKFSALLRDTLREDKDTNIHQCLAQLQAMLQPQPSKPGYPQPELTSLQLLQLLRTSLPGKFQEVQFDYFKFTKVCEDVLKRIRFTEVVELGLDFYNEKLGNGLREMIQTPRTGYFTIVWEAFAELAHRPVPFQLLVASKVMEKCIAGFVKQ